MTCNINITANVAEMDPNKPTEEETKKSVFPLDCSEIISMTIDDFIRSGKVADEMVKDTENRKKNGGLFHKCWFSLLMLIQQIYRDLRRRVSQTEEQMGEHILGSELSAEEVSRLVPEILKVFHEKEAEHADLLSEIYATAQKEINRKSPSSRDQGPGDGDAAGKAK